MKIESLIKRKNGTKIDMDGPKRQYHFKPTEDDERHIADVDVEHHAKSLLRITEGYRAVDPVDFQGDDEDNLPGRHLNGSKVHSASYVIKGGDRIELEDLVNMAFDDSGLTEEEWNDLADADRYEYINTTLKELQDGEHGDETEKVQTQEPANVPGDTTSNEPPATDATQNDSIGSDNTPAASQPVDTTATPVGADKNGNGIDDDVENLKGDALIAAYEARFGRKPSSAMRVADIRRALSEDDD